MIRNLGSSGRYLSVTGAGTPTPYINSGNQSAGMVRWNTSMNALEVYDGSSWQNVTNQYAAVDLTPEATELLDWAKQKRAEEAKLADLLKENPGLKDAWEKFEIMRILCTQGDKNA